MSTNLAMPVRGLAVPKHVARARAAAGPQPLPDGPITVNTEPAEGNDITAPIPPGILSGDVAPELYRMFLMPIALRRQTKSGIFLPDETLAASEWLVQIGRVAALGKYCFRGKAFRDIDFDIEADAPKIGDFVLYDPRAGRKMRFEATNFAVINDDQYWARTKTIEGFEFYGIVM